MNKYVESKAEALEVVERYFSEKPPVVAFDTETSGLEWTTDRLFLIQVGWGWNDNYAFTQPYWKYVKEILEDASSHKVAHNIKFDMHFLRNVGITPRGMLHDTQAMARLLLPASAPLGLKELAVTFIDAKADQPEKALKRWIAAEKRRRSKELTKALREIGYTRKEFDQMVKEKVPLPADIQALLQKIRLDVTYADVPREIMEPYATTDTRYTWMLFKKFGPLLRANGLIPVYERDMTVIRRVFRWERTGLEADVNYLKDGVAYGERRLMELEQEIYRMAGAEVNLNSPKQLLELFEKRGIKLESTDEEAMKNIQGQDPLAKKILEYRGYTKMVGTYFKPIYRKAVANNGRLYGSFNVTIPVTGRFSSSNPNLQNIPKDFDDEKLQVRKAIKPTDGYIFVFMDYSQMEVRIMAEYSKDKNLTEAILNGEDLHTKTALAIDPRAKELYIPGKHKDDQPPEFQKIRSHAKRTTFGIFYGIGAYKLSKQIKVDVETARNYIQNFFNLYPGVYKFIQDVQRVAKSRPGRWVMNKYGRIYWGEEDREYALVDYLIQGTGADMMKIAICRCEEELEGKKSRIVSMIHDELVFEIHKSELDLIPKLHAHMTNYPEFSIPIEVDIEYSDTNWAEKKPWRPELIEQIA